MTEGVAMFLDTHAPLQSRVGYGTLGVGGRPSS